MQLPATLGSFELREEIGRGGIATVYRAFDRAGHREVALKLLRDDLAGDNALVEDFVQEARNAAGLEHPHIGRVFSSGQQDGRHYIAMELLAGQTLERAIERESHLSELQVLPVAMDVTLALDFAYQRSIIHGDIKPANIFLVHKNGAKLLDFGMARLANVGMWSSDGVWGSPHYVSPERVQRLTETFCSDIYSLGATLFHALTGRPPFEAKSPEEVALRRLNTKAPLVRALNPNVSARTEQIVEKMLQLSPSRRYHSYEALLAALREAAAEVQAARGRGWWRRFRS